MDESEAPVKSFNITTKRMEFEPEIPNSQGKLRKSECSYLVTFVIENTGTYPDQHFEIPVWVSADVVDPDDVIRAARHQLHSDLAKLAEISASFRIRDEDLPNVFQTE